MICKRCGSECPQRPEGYCFHCLVGTGIEEALGKSLKELGIGEGFPNWSKPKQKKLKLEEK